MSLNQAITEIESVLTAAPVSLTKHPDVTDESLLNASASDGHFKVIVSDGGEPWPEAAPQQNPRIWICTVRIEVSTLIKTDFQAQSITSVGRGNSVVEALRFVNLTHGQLWPTATPTSETNDRLLLWSAEYNLRYEE